MIPARRGASVAFLTAGFLLTSASARAHSPIEGVGHFYGGFLHPLLLPAHALALAALGLLIGQQGLRHAESGLPAFGLGQFLGLGAAWMEWTRGVPAPLFLFAAAIGGVAVAVSPPLPRGATAVAAVALGLLIGLDSGPDLAVARQRAMAMAGTVLGALLALIYLIGMLEFLKRPWQRIAVRVVASWIAAISILTFALAASGVQTG